MPESLMPLRSLASDNRVKAAKMVRDQAKPHVAHIFALIQIQGRKQRRSALQVQQFGIIGQLPPHAQGLQVGKGSRQRLYSTMEPTNLRKIYMTQISAYEASEGGTHTCRSIANCEQSETCCCRQFSPLQPPRLRWLVVVRRDMCLAARNRRRELGATQAGEENSRAARRGPAGPRAQRYRIACCIYRFGQLSGCAAC